MIPARLRLALSILVGTAMAVIGGSIGAGLAAGMAGAPLTGMAIGGAAAFTLAASFTWAVL